MPTHFTFNYAKIQLEQVYLFILLIFPPRFPGGNDEMAIIVLIMQKRIVSNCLIIYHSKYILIYKFHFSSIFSSSKSDKPKKLVSFKWSKSWKCVAKFTAKYNLRKISHSSGAYIMVIFLIYRLYNIVRFYDYNYCTCWKKDKLKINFKIRPKKGGKLDLFTKKGVKIGFFQYKFKKGNFFAIFFLI